MCFVNLFRLQLVRVWSRFLWLFKHDHPWRDQCGQIPLYPPSKSHKNRLQTETVFMNICHYKFFAQNSSTIFVSVCDIPKIRGGRKRSHRRRRNHATSPTSLMMNSHSFNFVFLCFSGPKHSLRKSYLLILSSVLFAASFAIGGVIYFIFWRSRSIQFFKRLNVLQVLQVSATIFEWGEAQLWSQVIVLSENTKRWMGAVFYIR